MDDVVVLLMTRGEYLFVFFIILTVVFHVILFVVKPSKKVLLVVDYAWLLCAFFGLVKLTSDIRTIILNNYYFGIERKYEANKKICLNDIDGLDESLCRNFKKSEFSPGNFDYIQWQYNYACGWIKIKLNNVDDELIDVLIQDHDFFSSLKRNVREKIIAERVGSSEKCICLLRELKKDLILNVNEQNKTDSEFVFLCLSPLIFSVALSLRVTKVTGDWINTRTRK